MGFRPEVQNFQPFYVWNPRKLVDLQIGNAILNEYLELETEKQERAARSKAEEKQVREAAALKVHMVIKSLPY